MKINRCCIHNGPGGPRVWGLNRQALIAVIAVGIGIGIISVVTKNGDTRATSTGMRERGWGPAWLVLFFILFSNLIVAGINGPYLVQQRVNRRMS